MNEKCISFFNQVVEVHTRISSFVGPSWCSPGLHRCFRLLGTQRHITVVGVAVNVETGNDLRVPVGGWCR